MSRRRTAVAAFGVAAVLAVAGVATFWRAPAGEGAPVEAVPQPEPAPSVAAAPRGPSLGEQVVAAARRLEREPRARAAADDAVEPARVPAADRDAAFWRDTADIEDFKEALYALQIDRIDQIPKLDALVHVDVDDPRDLWETDWAGVDDWKRYRDGFSLERGPDGSLLFMPGEETQRMFTFFEGINLYAWDESQEAFVNEVDYYGKPIYNVVKFLREDVLVLMTISGHKVDMNLFQQGEYR